MSEDLFEESPDLEAEEKGEADETAATSHVLADRTNTQHTEQVTRLQHTFFIHSFLLGSFTTDQAHNFSNVFLRIPVLT
jgi:hypothetical protein